MMELLSEGLEMLKGCLKRRFVLKSRSMHLLSENELAAARFQGKYVAMIASKLAGHRRDN